MNGSEPINPLDHGKIVYHFDVLDHYRRHGVIRPVHISFGLNSLCNHSCIWCYIEYDKRKQTMRTDKMLSLFDELKEWGIRAMTFVGDGEPLMHKDFAPAVRRLKELGIEVGVFTNGAYLKGEKAEALLEWSTFVRISLDAATAETHKIVHRSDDFEEIISNVENFIKMRERPHRPTVGVQFATCHLNVHEIPAAAEMLKKIGVDYISLKPVYHNDLNPEPFHNLATMEQVSAAYESARHLECDSFRIYPKTLQFHCVLENGEQAERTYEKCLAHSFSPYIEDNGRVEFCGNLKGRGFTIGNVNDKKFSDIWYSEEHRAAIERIDLSKCPRGCKMHKMNLVLHRLFSPPAEMHVNFI